MKHPLQQLLLNEGEPRRHGIYSVCSAHPHVIQAAAEQSRDDDAFLLLEATSNQVNQHGGYTGLRPSDFRRFAEEITDAAGLDRSRLILGGDHLGPNPWRSLPASEAISRAEELIDLYARAGFSKLHLDTSMACGDDPSPLTDELIAERAARLCAIAERATTDACLPAPVYVIGTEVPTPGGATHALHELAITTPEAAQRTLDVHEHAFRQRDLTAAWQRVVAMVVQPGVEFDHDSVIDYSRDKATALSAWLRHSGRSLVFEAHSTDYQRPRAYADLVGDGFRILKVGPALTFALREALFALAGCEAELVPEAAQSHLPAVLEQVMVESPGFWKPYYEGTPREQKRLRTFSYSDRIRYYWPHPNAEAAVSRLVQNLTACQVPESMLSASLPSQYERIRAGALQNSPLAIVVDKVRDVLRTYAAAC